MRVGETGPKRKGAAAKFWGQTGEGWRDLDKQGDGEGGQIHWQGAVIKA